MCLMIFLKKLSLRFSAKFKKIERDRQIKKNWAVCSFGPRGPILKLDPILETSDPTDWNNVNHTLTSEAEGGLHKLIKYYGLEVLKPEWQCDFQFRGLNVYK